MVTTKKHQAILAKLALTLAAGCFAFSGLAMADEEFYGTVESRPVANPGIWTISGQQVEVTDSTDVDSGNGPLVIGSCVEVEHNEGVVKEIESAKPSKCGRK